MEYSNNTLSEVSEKVFSIRMKNTCKIIETAKEYIRTNYCINAMSLNMVAEKVSKNPRYLSKLFKNETGENFISFVTRLRIEKAKELLCDIGIKLTEITKLVGYADVSYFIKIFKKYTGISPTEYRNTMGASERAMHENENLYCTFFPELNEIAWEKENAYKYQEVSSDNKYFYSFLVM